MASEQLSNVIGAPFAEHVLTQLNLRAAHNSTGDGTLPTRSNDEILFLANKMSWVKLTSSVGVLAESNNGIPVPISEYYKKLGLDYANADDLAKNWTLQAGTSKAKGAEIDLRYGVGPDGAYGLGGTEELGYRPMPGLTSVNIDTKGALGSLREATIQFKVWNMNQLDIVEALYFRLGYSMLLEWGHNQFYTNVNKEGSGGTFTTNTYGINPFQGNLRKEKVQQQIAQRSYALSGNYDGMLGVVTNFQWSFNQTGGYDCTLRLIGLGAIMDSLRINLSYTMPSSIFQEYKKQAETLQKLKEREDQIKAQQEEAKKRTDAGLPDTIPTTPSNPKEIYTNIYTADKGSSSPPPGQDTFLSDIALPIAYTFAGGTDRSKDTINTVYDYYYKAEKGGKYGSAFITELNTKKTGLFLNSIPNLRSTWQVVPAENYPAVTLSAGQLNATATRANLGYIDFNSKELLGANAFIKTFDNALYHYPAGKSYLSAVTDLVTGRTTTYAPDDLVYPQSEALIVEIRQFASVLDPIAKSNKEKIFDLKITYTAAALPPEGDKELAAADKLSRPKRKEIIAALENWFLNSRTVQILSIEPTSNSPKQVTVKGTITFPIPNKGVEVILDIEFTNTALIQSVLPPPVPKGTPQSTAQSGSAGDNGGIDNNSEPTQTDPGFKFASALHAMLAVAKSQVEYNMSTNQEGVVTIPLVEVTKKFYEGSILEKLFDTQENPNTTEFDLIQYAKKGFNSSLMVNYKKDPTLFGRVESVKFNELCLAYGIRWTIQGDDNKTSHPTYIKLGYLLSFLNAMCLVYDSTVNTDKHPYVYLDFNPYTNFCLTMPQHMSVDPFTCMIPYQGDQTDYLKLFPPDVAPNPDPRSPVLFNDSINAVSGWLPKFKASSNAYQGSTMEILLNIDFLIGILNARTTSSSDHTVDLKGFLDDIMTGINKATGNLNSFRVAYRDDSNTVIIKDDQFVPPMKQEETKETYAMTTQATNGIDGENYGVPNGVNVPKYGQLPIFGKYSLVRELKFETDMSTKMSNVIAISGQSNTNSVNSTDHSSFSWLNTNFQDRYKPLVSDSSEVGSKSNNKTTEEDKKKQEKEANKAASEFNQHVVSIYKGESVALSKEMVPAAINYYINGIAQVKSRDGLTLAAPFIPANLSMTVDGIAGIIMGNAFTIPEDRLPLSLRGQAGIDKNTKVGFVVVGLTHSLDNNQWLTKIRGQMIKLRDSSEYGVVKQLEKLKLNFPTVTTSTTPTFTGDAFESALNFIKAQEALASIQKLDTSSRNRRIFYAPKNPSPNLIIYPYNLEGNVRADGTPRLTIGWGTYDVYRAGPKAGQIIAPNDTITAQLAEENLRVELASLYKILLDAAKNNNVTPTTGQVVALLDLGYNAGPGGMRSSPLWKALIGKQTPNKNEFVSYRVGTDFAGPLSKRRALEYNTFIS